MLEIKEPRMKSSRNSLSSLYRNHNPMLASINLYPFNMPSLIHLSYMHPQYPMKSYMPNMEKYIIYIEVQK